MIEPHYHWKFIAYNGLKEAKEIRFGVYITVIGHIDEKHATIAAADIVKREHYLLTTVWKCNECDFRKQVNEALETIAGKE
jgi:hypothetical protein